MILPNFLQWEALTKLRSQMAAPLADSFSSATFKTIILPLIQQLEGNGVDINIDDISSLADGTIGYRGHRVLLYIRDVAGYAGRSYQPRFHLTFCSTLRSKQQMKQMSKYVVATRNDGQFIVHDRSAGGAPSLMKLVVCQNCLADIAWNGFNSSQSKESKTTQARDFSLTEYFAKYPRDLFAHEPKYNSDTSPSNVYPPNWDEIAAAVKEKRRYKCEDCGKRLVDENSRFLHAHHINGRKDESNEENLRVLCVRCHANQPNHGHLKSRDDYVTFVAKYG